MNPQPARRGESVSWETATLGWLSYPANLAFAGVAAFVLALPVVTAVSAATAAGVALERWRAGDEGGVFFGTFKAWRSTWRRTLGVSVLGTVLSAIMVVNWLFLLNQESPVALVLLGALIPLTLVLLLVLVHFPAAVAGHTAGAPREWLRAAFMLSLARPLRSLGVCVLVITWGAFCLLLPTIIPFFGLSVPVLVGLLSANNQVRRVGS